MGRGAWEAGFEAGPVADLWGGGSPSGKRTRACRARATRLDGRGVISTMPPPRSAGQASRSGVGGAGEASRGQRRGRRQGAPTGQRGGGIGLPVAAGTTEMAADQKGIAGARRRRAPGMRRRRYPGRRNCRNSEDAVAHQVGHQRRRPLPARDARNQVLSLAL